MRQWSRRCAIPLLTLAAACAETRGTEGQSNEGQSEALPECDPTNGGLELPEGFCATIFADELGNARHLTVAENGDVFVRLGSLGDEGTGIVALRDTTGNGQADVARHFEESEGTGIAIHDGYLYYSTDLSVHRYPLAEGELVPAGQPQTIIEGFPDAESHGAKSLAFDDAGSIFVNSGAPSNNCEAAESRPPETPGHDPCPQLELSAGVWRYDAAENGQQHNTGNRFATGIRNAVALAWNPVAGGAYAVQHGRDQLDTLWPELFTAEQNAEAPSEDLLRLEQDADFGWPYCYHDPEQGRRVTAPEYGGDGTTADRCEGYADPLVAFPGHWAPNDLLFYSGEQFPERYRGGAFVAFHGSWNRAPIPQDGYKVTFVPFSGAEPAGDWEVFADGFPATRPIEGSQDVEFRPAGLAQGPDGSLYIADSTQGRIWRVMHP